MFKNKASNTTIMKHLLISATLLLILLAAFGCGDSNNVLVPEDTNSGVFAAPPNEPKIYHREGWIGPSGGEIHVHGNTKVIFPEKALDDDVYITVDVEVYKSENKIHYIFGPHGTVFNVPVQVEMSWSYLKNYEGPLELWYLDNGRWSLVENSITDTTNSRIIVNVDHFSEYYFPRR